jgi:hypothetical protein
MAQRLRGKEVKVPPPGKKLGGKKSKDETAKAFGKKKRTY